MLGDKARGSVLTRRLIQLNFVSSSALLELLSIFTNLLGVI